MCYLCRYAWFSQAQSQLFLPTAAIMLQWSLLTLMILLTTTTTCPLYTVTPDDHDYPNTTCHHCHNLQHYLLNITKYFTSNTQLFFLPGLHHLYTDLIIKNVHNISLIGSTANGTTLNTVIIQCNSSGSIVMNNISSLTMKSIQISNCLTTIGISTELKHGLVLKNCYNVHLNKVAIVGDIAHQLLAVNTLGNSSFLHLTCNKLRLLFHDSEVNTSNKYHSLLIKNYNMMSDHDKLKQVNNIISVHMFQYFYKVKLEFLATKFTNLFDNCSHLLDVKLLPNKLGNLFSFNHCIFEKIGCCEHSKVLISLLQLQSQETTNALHLYDDKPHQVRFIDCQFLHLSNTWCVLIEITGTLIDILIKDCIFTNSTMSQLIEMYHYFKQTGYFESVYHKMSQLSTVLISNTTFRNIRFYYAEDFITLRGTVLLLEGPVVFVHFHGPFTYSTLSLPAINIIFLDDVHSLVICHGNVDFSGDNIVAFSFKTDYGDINTNKFIFVKENSFINMTNIRDMRRSPTLTIGMKNSYNYLNNLPCFFQYISQRGNLDNEMKNAKHLNYSIEINQGMPILMNHCRWLSGSAFFTTRPIDVNKEIIKNFHLPAKVLCACIKHNKPNCYADTLALVYPGQSVTVSFAVNETILSASRLRNGVYFPAYGKDENGTIITVEMNDNEVAPTACKLATPTEATRAIHEHCTTVNYTILHSSLNYLKWCELFVRIHPNHYEAFYINMLPCPPGFVQSNAICICDPLLNTEPLSITTCDINHQTVLRPPGSWLSAVTINNSHQYYISPHCPLHYCLPHASQFSFSTAHLQCQFKRSRKLCGCCRKGFSTVFGSFNCQHCSNAYLFLIIPIAVAGLVLILLLFILNLTVTDGDINGFILFVNIISINSHVFFPEYRNFIYVFISLANLDLGIPVCFYNGMDDYAKMWFQLAFPAYLIIIAILIIIASRHSVKVQRITARRALPVLATLFLLSYTKILRTVSSVLFYYSTITHLPSGHNTLVWAVDANVPLFGLKYTILFIVCLILFIILLPFNVILCFTKTAMRLKLVNRFKPLIDAYQGPYKYKYYYWGGVQLIMRAVFFGLSALDRNTNLTIGVTLLATISIIQAKISPFKSEYKNFNDLCFLYMLLVIYIFSYRHYNIVIKIMIIIAAFYFLLIIIYHMINSICGGVIIYKLRGIIDKCTSLIAKLINRLRVQNEPENLELNNIPPDVAIDYSEYQEPLVGYN